MKELMQIVGATPQNIVSIEIDSKEIQKKAELATNMDLRKIYLQGKGIEKIVKTVMQGIRPVLMKRVEEKGKKINGHKTLNVNGGVVEVQSRKSQGFDEEKALEILKEKGLVEEAVKWFVDKEAIQRLVKEGKLSQDEYDQMKIQKDPILALVVR